MSGLPPGAIEIAREARSLETALQWSAVAGDSLPKVVEYEIHRRAKPRRLHQGQPAAAARPARTGSPITRLAVAHAGGPHAAVRAGDGELKSLARALDETQLDSLSRYLTGLDKASAQRVLRVVAQTPARMAELGKPRVRDAILASQRPGGSRRHDAAGQLACPTRPSAGARCAWCSTAA